MMATFVDTETDHLEVDESVELRGDVTLTDPGDYCLALARVRRGIGASQRNVARRAGIAPRTLSRIELGQRRTRLETLGRVSAALAGLDNRLHGGALFVLLVNIGRPVLAPPSAFAERACCVDASGG